MESLLSFNESSCFSKNQKHVANHTTRHQGNKYRVCFEKAYGSDMVWKSQV